MKASDRMPEDEMPKKKKLSFGSMINAILKWGIESVRKSFAWIKDQVIPWAEAKPKQAAVTAVVLSVLAGLTLGHALIVNGLILGLITAGAVGILFLKMKTSENESVQEIHARCMEHPLLTDAVITCLALLVFPASVTGLLGAATAGILASVFLMHESSQAHKHSDSGMLDVKGQIKIAA